MQKANSICDRGDFLQGLLGLQEADLAAENGYLSNQAESRFLAIQQANHGLTLILLMFCVVWFEMDFAGVRFGDHSADLFLFSLSALNVFVGVTKALEYRALFDLQTLTGQKSAADRFLTAANLRSLLVEAFFVVATPNYFLTGPRYTFPIYIDKIDDYYALEVNKVLLCMALFRIMYHNPLSYFSRFFHLQGRSAKRLLRVFGLRDNINRLRFYLADNAVATIAVNYASVVGICSYAMRVLES